MCSLSQRELKDEVKHLLAKLGAFRVGVADPSKGFDKAVRGCHPRDVMETCNSVVVFAFGVGLSYYASMVYQHNDVRLGHLYRDSATLRLLSLLRRRHDAMGVPRGDFDERNRIAYMSYKLAAYEAGIGVFGRSSMIVTLEHGPRVNLGVVLTDALMEPDGRMSNFDPCLSCETCIEVCPVGAIKPDLPAPTGFDRNRCVQFVYWLRRQTRNKHMLCGCCFNQCPAGKAVRKTVTIKSWKTLMDLDEQSRERLVKGYVEHDCRFESSCC